MMPGERCRLGAGCVKGAHFPLTRGGSERVRSSIEQGENTVTPQGEIRGKP